MTPSTKHRLFIALGLPDLQRNLLTRLVKELQPAYSFAHWIDSRDYHITLQFLGLCSIAKISAIEKQLASLTKGHSPFMLQIDGFGTFGPPQSPRVLWANIAGQRDALHELQKAVVSALEIIGFSKEERPYRPHITLAKKYTGKNFSLSKIPSLGATSPEWQVGEIRLYRSRLKQTSLYETIARYSLVSNNS